MKAASYLLLAVAFGLTACKPAASNTAAPSADKAAANVAGETNLAADEHTIRDMSKHWIELVRSKYSAAIVQLYTEDGALMPPNTSIAKGRAAIQQGWAAMVNSPGFDLTFAPEQVVVSASGDMALDRGTYRLGEDTGKYVVVWRKIGGEWKAAADIFNSDKPEG